jgi:hypothetical protein
MTFWIDLDNSPHVLLFAPIIRELERRGVRLIITVREFAQTRELARRHGLEFTTVGKHYGSASKIVKVGGTLRRAASLAKFVRGHEITAAISQGSRALVLAAKAMRLPVMTLYDYEFASCRLYNMFSDRITVPEVIPSERLVAQGLDLKKLVRYPGLKEEVYVYGFKPDNDVADKLELDKDKVIVTLRPPAQWAHYHHERSEIMFRALMDRLKREGNVQVVIPARTEAQAEELRRTYGLSGRFRIFTRPVDGLSLMWCSDLVFSGGGTMTREAALLGLNVYTIFGGRLGAGDESLIRDGRLKALREPAELDRISFERREKALAPSHDHKQLATHLADEMVRFAEEMRRPRAAMATATTRSHAS